jgi:adenosylcobinamide-phosphate synthase
VEKVVVLLIAVLLDAMFGEPPNVVHPTVWFGKIIGFFDRFWKRKNCLIDFIAGSTFTLIVLLFAYSLALVAINLPTLLRIALESYLLFSAISIRSMVEHARRTIQNGHVIAEEVKKIVSRDVAKLDQSRLSSAVIESIAENFVDGVLAPLLYYSLFGIAGAVVYRAINTCDAMIGYRTERYACFGKFSARLDDLANFVPARLSALLFLAFKPSALRVVKRYRKIKLNGGYPISAMAGILGVTLEKPSYYKVEAGRYPNAEDVRKAICIYVKLCALSVAIALACLCLRETLA